MSVKRPPAVRKPSDFRFCRITSTRTLLPILEIESGTGRVRSIALSEEELWQIISDAAHILSSRRMAQRLNGGSASEE